MSFLRNLFGPPKVDELKAKKNVKGLIKALAHEDENLTQYFAARALGEIGDPSAVEPLMETLQVGTQGREAAAKALGKIGDERAVDLLLWALKDESEDVRESAAWALGEIGAVAALEPLHQSLQDESLEVRFEAAMAMAKLGDARAVDPLIRSLKRGTDEERIKAAQSLGEIGDPRAVESLMAALLDRAFKVCEAAEQALVDIGSASVSPLVDAIQTGTLKKDYEDATRRAGAVLAEIGPPAEEALVALLQDKQWKVRRMAARALKKMAWDPRDEALGAIYFVALSDWKSCARMGTRGVRPLIDALTDGDEDARRSAATALGKIGDPTAVEALMRSLGDKSDDVRAFAAQSLGQIGDPRAIDPLIALCRDSSSRIRIRAASALGEIGDPQAAKPLQGALADRDWDVRESAAAALEKLGLPPDKSWARVDIGKLNVCAKCRRSEQRILADFEAAKRRGITVIGDGDVLYYCVHCEKSFCGRCQVDLHIAVGCPICGDKLQPASKILAYQ